MELLLHVWVLLFVGVNCLTEDELAAFTPRHPDYTDTNTGLNSVVWAKDNNDGSQTIYTNGIPSHETWTFPNNLTRNPNYIEEINTTLNIFSEPIMRDEPLRCLPLGYLGIATSGVVIDSWFPSQQGCPEVMEFEELDICEGHPSPRNQYHYHHYSPCVQMPVCGEPSTIWGVALDGIPIYGPIGEDGVQLTKADLDECGGKYDSSGRYKYHMTVDPPYSMGCFWGEIRSDVGKNARSFTCSCPFDDRVFSNRRPPRQAPGRMGAGRKSNCKFDNSNTSAPAACVDRYDETYDIGYKWEYQERDVALAPCCPQGQDCGDSCKTENGIKDICVQETKTVPYWTRVAKSYDDDTEMNSAENENMIVGTNDINNGLGPDVSIFGRNVSKGGMNDSNVVANENSVVLVSEVSNGGMNDSNDGMNDSNGGINMGTNDIGVGIPSNNCSFTCRNNLYLIGICFLCMLIAQIIH